MRDDASIRVRLLAAARRQATMLGLDRLSVAGVCAEAEIDELALYDVYPGGLDQLKETVIELELERNIDTLPWFTGTLFDDLVELARWLDHAVARHRGFVLACVSALYLSQPLGRVLREKLARAFVLLTRWFAAYWHEGVWHERYDRVRIDELSDRLVVSFIAGIVTRHMLTAFGLASRRFDPELHVTEWLHGVGRTPAFPQAQNGPEHHGNSFDSLVA